MVGEQLNFFTAVDLIACLQEQKKRFNQSLSNSYYIIFIPI